VPTAEVALVVARQHRFPLIHRSSAHLGYGQSSTATSGTPPDRATGDVVAVDGSAPDARYRAPDADSVGPGQATQIESSLFVKRFFRTVGEGVLGLEGRTRLLVGRSVVVGPGVARPKRRCSGCEPVTQVSVSFPGCPPGPVDVRPVARASSRKRV